MKTAKKLILGKGEKIYKVFLSKKSLEIDDFVALVVDKNKVDATRRYLITTNATNKRLAQKYIFLKPSKVHNVILKKN